MDADLLQRRATVELELIRTDALIEYRERALEGARRLAPILTNLANERLTTMIEEEHAKQAEAKARVRLAELAVEQRERALDAPLEATLARVAQRSELDRLKRQLAESEASNTRLRQQLMEEDEEL
jgi:transposase-like protein